MGVILPVAWTDGNALARSDRRDDDVDDGTEGVDLDTPDVDDGMDGAVGVGLIEVVTGGTDVFLGERGGVDGMVRVRFGIELFDGMDGVEVENRSIVAAFRSGRVEGGFVTEGARTSRSRTRSSLREGAAVRVEGVEDRAGRENPRPITVDGVDGGRDCNG